MNLAKLINGKIANRKLKRHIAELVRICEAEDMAAFEKATRKVGAFPSSERVAEMTFHKVRVELTGVSRAKRKASAQWLSDRGLSTMTGGDPMQAIPEPIQ